MRDFYFAVGDVPLDVKIRQSCDFGLPVTLKEDNAIVSTAHILSCVIVVFIIGSDLYKD